MSEGENKFHESGPWLFRTKQVASAGLGATVLGSFGAGIGMVGAVPAMTAAVPLAVLGGVVALVAAAYFEGYRPKKEDLNENNEPR